jgi:hypothetical protein
VCPFISNSHLHIYVYMQCSPQIPRSRLHVTNGNISKSKEKQNNPHIQITNAAFRRTNTQLPYNSLPCNAASDATPLMNLMGHDPLKLLPEDARLDGVGEVLCVPPAAVTFAGARVVGLAEADETWRVGEPVAEPEGALLEEDALLEEEALGVEALGGAAEAAEGASTAAAAAGTEDIAGAEGCVCDWDEPEGVGVGVGVGAEVGFCTSASALPLPSSLGAGAALAGCSAASSSIWECMC